MNSSNNRTSKIVLVSAFLGLLTLALVLFLWNTSNAPATKSTPTASQVASTAKPEKDSVLPISDSSAQLNDRALNDSPINETEVLTAVESSTPQSITIIPTFTAESLILYSPGHPFNTIMATAPLSYQERNAYVTALGRNMSDDEVTQVLSFLQVPFDAELGMEPLEFNALKNNLLNQLLRQENRDYSYMQDHLGHFSQDATLDPVFRNYAVQFQAQFMKRVMRNGSDERVQMEHEKYRKNLANAYTRPYEDVSGTALLGQVHLTETFPALFMRNDVIEQAVILINHPNATSDNYLSAVQALARMDASEALPMIRDAIHQEHSPTVTMSLIAALGVLGDPTDKPLLTQLATSTDRRIKTAAQAALQRL